MKLIMVCDNGLSLGAAIIIAKENGFKIDKYQNPFWGPEYTNEQIEYVLTRAKVRFECVKEISKEVAHLVTQRKIIGWFQGRMELGARALGSRSILSDPSDIDMKDRLNKYVKFREDFRTFAPSVLEERAPEYFINCRYAPFMAITYNVRPEKIREIPTPTHIDNTARVQTVSKIPNGLYYDLIKNFEYHLNDKLLPWHESALLFVRYGFANHKNFTEGSSNLLTSSSNSNTNASVGK